MSAVWSSFRHQRWVFQTPPEKWHKDCILPKNRHQVKLMVWGCFWGSQRGPLPANGSVTARVYRSLLRRWLLPVLEDMRASLGNPRPLFQQDNARIHTAELRNGALLWLLILVYSEGHWPEVQ